MTTAEIFIAFAQAMAIAAICGALSGFLLATLAGREKAKRTSTDHDKLDWP